MQMFEVFCVNGRALQYLSFFAMVLRLNGAITADANGVLGLKLQAVAMLHIPERRACSASLHSQNSFFSATAYTT